MGQPSLEFLYPLECFNVYSSYVEVYLIYLFHCMLREQRLGEIYFNRTEVTKKVCYDSVKTHFIVNSECKNLRNYSYVMTCDWLFFVKILCL